MGPCWRYEVLNARRRDKPCCNACEGFPVSWIGSTASASTSKGLMPSARVIPRHTAKCQVLLQDHQWEGDKPLPRGGQGARVVHNHPGSASPALAMSTTGSRERKGRSRGVSPRSASLRLPAAASPGSGHAAALWANPAGAQMVCVRLHLHSRRAGGLEIGDAEGLPGVSCTHQTCPPSYCSPRAQHNTEEHPQVHVVNYSKPLA